MKRKIEVFTANSPMCEPVVKLVNELACDNCELTVYVMVRQYNDKVCVSKAREYGISRIPAVAVDGKLLSCCQPDAITKEDLVNAGVGKNASHKL